MSSVLDVKRPIILDKCEDEVNKMCVLFFEVFARARRFHFRFLFVLLVSMFCPKCEAGIHLPSPRIYRGKEAQIGEHGHPYVVSIQYLVEREVNGVAVYRHFCGGVIVDDRNILTAGHCFLGHQPHCWTSDPSDCLRIVAGTNNISSDFQEEVQIRVFPTSAITVHESYNETYYGNDIAMVHLEVPLHFNNVVQGIQLVKPGTRNLSKVGVISGWGEIKENVTSSTLQEANVTIYDNSYCDNQWPNVYQRDEMLCAGNGLAYNEKLGNTDILADGCRGDSGGPLVVTSLRNPRKKYLAGLISSGSGPCGSDPIYYPGLYTRITTYIDWITANERKTGGRRRRSPKISQGRFIKSLSKKYQ